MSKHEPYYQCSICALQMLTEEIDEHTEYHIQMGILKKLKHDDSLENHRVESQL